MITLAYLTVIVIWSTTPLAIKWSSLETGYIFAITARMFIGAFFCTVLVRLLGKPFPWHRDAVLTYLAAALGIFVGLLFVYKASTSVPSGVVAVLFGLSTLATGIISRIILKERSLTALKLFGMVSGLAGLYIIFGESFGPAQQAAVGGVVADSRYDYQLGVLYVLMAVFIQALSMVLVQKRGSALPPLSITAGGLIMSLPAFLLLYLLNDPVWPTELFRANSRGWASILYLSVMGSVVGFILFFYLIQKIGSGKLSYTALITPVTALLLAQYLEKENITPAVWIGAALILVGLFSHSRPDRERERVAQHQT